MKGEIMELTSSEAALIRALREMDEVPSNVWLGYISMQEDFTKTMESIHEPTSRPLQWQREKQEKANKLRF